MALWRLALLNLALPGAGLLIAGHLVPGLVLLVPTVILLALIIGTLALFTSAAAWPMVMTLALIYGLLALSAGGWWWRQARRLRIDPQAVRALQRTAVIAYLQRRDGEALSAAQRLVTLAPEESGAWHFLALVATAAKHPAVARRATARGRSIDDR